MSFSFFDFESQDQPFRQTIVEEEIGDLDEYVEFKVEVPLQIYSADINDELINPFPSEDTKYYYLDAEEIEVTT